MKKIITAIFMMVIVLFGGLMFTGCGKGENGEAVFEKFDGAIQEMKEESSPFKAQTKNYITSNFMLQNLEKKVGNSKQDYLDQDELIALGLNYIEKYYPLAKDYKKSANIDSINSALKKLDKSYQTLKKEYQSLGKITFQEEEIIYNGFVARYAEAARKFASVVFDCAKALENYLADRVKVAASLQEEQPTQQAIAFYVDSRMMEIYGDYSCFLMENAKASAAEMEEDWYLIQKENVKTTLSKEEISRMMTYFDSIEGERKLTQKAFKNFSYYDYKVLYNGDVKAYEKTNVLAGVYHNQIERYFDNVLDYLYDYTMENLYQ